MGRIYHTSLGVLLFGMNLGLHIACSGHPIDPAGGKGLDASSRADGSLVATRDAATTADAGARDAGAGMPDASGERPDAGDVTRMAIDHLTDEYCAWRARCSGAAGSCGVDPVQSAERSFVTLESFDPAKVAAIAGCFHDLDTCGDAETAIARCVTLTTLNQRLVIDCFDKDACPNTSWGRDWCAIAPLLDDELESSLSRCASLPDCAAAESCLEDLALLR